MKSVSRIQQLFASQKACIAYLTAGDGGIRLTLKAALALIEGGANMLEIGVPFSDPIADGPVIQRAAARSLAAGTTLQDILWLTQQIRLHSDVPLILFSYLNPILAALHTDFLRAAKGAGIDGLLLVDCPPEESLTLRDQCMQNAIDLIYVITPSTPIARIKKIDHYARGFLYYACRKGTTGLHNNLPEHFRQQIGAVKSSTNLPVVAGFGISSLEMTRTVLECADGVVAGSLFVKALEEGMDASGLTALARRIYPVSEHII